MKVLKLLLTSKVQSSHLIETYIDKTVTSVKNAVDLLLKIDSSSSENVVRAKNKIYNKTPQCSFSGDENTSKVQYLSWSAYINIAGNVYYYK